MRSFETCRYVVWSGVVRRLGSVERPDSRRSELVHVSARRVLLRATEPVESNRFRTLPSEFAPLASR
ncbi:hypothetical protein C485_02756 [Natrinema altunense JCM 12890]|uniref:Uncharacterized protein n=1 Tax=Natrinema altunense (strain JCM 12890 / CGMCC 1.3731 / AJ2) TaxID=1227494 RepID=L9ZW61_NATA2|nr:hypothetical protein C485_02756 [Natrinema altunense JCM 12890]